MKYLFVVLFLIVSCKSVDKNQPKELAFPVSDSPLSIVPIIKVENDILIFRLAAKRNEIVEKEYFPTSENLRIIIRKENGKIIYKSNEGMNYFQAIEDVKPIEINDVYVYELKTPMPKGFDKGKYKITYILPARPVPYQTELEYEHK